MAYSKVCKNNADLSSFLETKITAKRFEYVCLFVIGQILPKKFSYWYFLIPSYSWLFGQIIKKIVSVNFVFKSILKIDENNWYIVQKVGGEPLKSIQFQ